MSDAHERLEWRQLRRLVRFAVVSVVLTFLAAIMYASLLVPILVSCFLTYLLLPLVDRLAKWRVPRTLAVGVIVIGSVGALVLTVVRLTPVVYHQLTMLIHLIPSALSAVLSTWLPAAEKYVSELGLMDATEAHNMLSAGNITGRIANQLQGGVTGLWKTGTSVAGGMVNAVLIPVLTFFLLKDHAGMTKALGSIVPRDLVVPVQRLVHKMDLTLRSVLKGQAIVAGILTVLYVVGLSIVGIQSSVAIGVVAGVCRIIPYFDVVVGGILCTIVLISNFTGWGQVLSVVLVFVVVQGIDGAFITPSVIGERVGLHPLLVILSVLAFGDWLGFWGVLLAIPIAACAKVLVEASVPYYLSSGAYTSNHD